MYTAESGKFKKHLSGKAAFHSFIPESLQTVCRQAAPGEERFWHKSREAGDAAQDTEKQIRELNGDWQALTESEKEKIGDLLLKKEAERSVLMAYPRKKESIDGSSPSWGDFFLDFQDSDQKQKAGGNLINREDTIDDIPDDFREMAAEDIENLYQAGLRGVKWMEALPLSGRLLKEMHRIALYGRHYDKMYRGEFRASPVWMGEAGKNLQSAEFVPPVEEDMDASFSDMEKFLHYEEDVHPLVKAALLHYQFETIHPFIDGNGRMGRMLVLLFLKDFCGLEIPWIQLSGTLLQGIDRYYKEIRSVQLNGTYPRWCSWFLRVMGEAARRTQTMIREGSRN